MTDQDRFSEPKITINKVYTRQGDGGGTRLVGGQPVSKTDLRLHCYGSLDELNSIVGMARTMCLTEGLDGLAKELLRIQHGLFNLGTVFATLPEDLTAAMPQVAESDVVALEESMDRHNEALPTLRSFILPGGGMASSQFHLARTVCRRVERICVGLAQETDIPPVALTYLNRLSDAFFVWGRVAAAASDEGEVLWDPNLA